MEKLYNEQGQVAVAVSYRFGAGWSTWVDVSPLDKRYNELILKGDINKAVELAEEEEHFSGGLEDCKLEWLDVGTKFRINEYDGSESLVVLDDEDYLEA